MLWTIGGWIAFGLGVVGAVLPLLPTVPFMLLAAFCFARSSDRVHALLITHPRLGPPISDWQSSGAIRPPAKVAATLAIAASFGISLWLALPPLGLIAQAKEMELLEDPGQECRSMRDPAR